MNPPTHQHPQPPDPHLSALLRSWDVPATLPHGFAPAVWRRIDARAHAQAHGAWRTLLAWLDSQLRRPLAAPACLAVLLLAGIGAGSLHGRASSLALTAGLQGRYIQSIDPFAAHPR